jgi:hypothetical protein
MQDSSITLVNPTLIGILENESIKNLTRFADHYFNVGYERLNSESDIQGFFTDCLYGKKEPEHGEKLSWQSHITSMLDLKDKTASDKAREAFEWMELSKRFVTSCGKLWTKAQGAAGLGYNKAVWDNDPSKLGTMPRRERQELVKLFEAWGCFDVAVAWFIFVCGIAERDEKKRLVFDITAPHRQFVTIDKKPSQFAKHFNAILSDEYFISYSTDENDRKEITEQLREYYGDLLEIQPRFISNENEN